MGDAALWRRALDFPAMRQVVGDVPLGGSPFPPIADYAFLSDCERARSSRRAATSSGCACRASTAVACSARSSTATPAASGSGRPTRGARRPPLHARHDGARDHLGHADGWLIVRDALLIGPWHHDDERSHTHRRSPTDYDADHVLLRTVRCVNGSVEMHMDCEPVLRLRPQRGHWEYDGRGLPRGRRRGRGRRHRAAPDDRPAPGLRGRRAPARARRCTTATPRSSRSSWTEHAPPRDATTRPTSASSHRATSGTSGSSTASSPTTRGGPPAAQRAHAQGPDVRADRRDGRRRDDVAAGDARRRAQLGLPLHVDPRLHVHALGPATRSASTGRRTTSSTSSPTSPRTTDELQIMYGIGGETRARGARART